MTPASNSATDDQANGIQKPRHIALFITCLVDLFRPTVGFASIKLLEDAGCIVSVPPAQTCCGQPAYNSGDKASTRDIACQVIQSFETYDAVVAPSGSCTAMIKKHYPELFEGGTNWHQRASALADKTFELTSFLTDILNVDPVTARFDGTVTYHDSCSGLRELGVRDQPRRLLKSVDGLSVAEMKDCDVCCGFGGTFCIKYPDISDAIVSKKTAHVEATQAPTLLAGDLGCLMNMAGKLQREGKQIEVRHVAEVLAGMTTLTPPIGTSLMDQGVGNKASSDEEAS